jgi:hydroxymethylbilane synthase
VGTGSPRRAAQLRALHRGLEIVEVRGNVDTRLRQVAEGRLDAVVLALSGLRRLGRAGEVSEVLEPDVMLPAPGQGALALECRDDDAAVLAALAPLDDPVTRACVSAERTLLATLEAGCAAPLGALAQVVHAVDGALLSVRALVASVDGEVVLRRSAAVPFAGDGVPAALGHRLAGELLADGAAALVARAVPAPAPAEPDAPDQPPTPSSAGQTSSQAREGDL